MTYKFPRVVIAGLSGGSGKTTLSVGLSAALRRRGISITPFKKGPDYIDAGWLAASAGSPCYNLDPFLIGPEKVLESFLLRFRPQGAALIEGNRGIFDGMDAEGSFSTAKVAEILKSPVILVVDCTKMTRTAASLVLGVKVFDRTLRLGGVVLNKVSGKRHESVIRRAVETYAGLPVLGAMPRAGGGAFPERHMGLTPTEEHPAVRKAVAQTARLIEGCVDVGAVLSVMNSAPILRGKRPGALAKAGHGGAGPPVKIGVVKDSAFQFYYPENIGELRERGAKIIELSAIKSMALPEIDALYIGGGFPETHAVALSGNRALMRSIVSAVEGGLPVYAECGGLMYLGRYLKTSEGLCPMAGVLPLGFSLSERPEAHGYTVAEAIRENPFYPEGTVIRGHEFHYSRPEGFRGKKAVYFALGMKRGRGLRDGLDGLCYKNVFASYTHVHALGVPEWAEGMLRAALSFRRERGG